MAKTTKLFKSPPGFPNGLAVTPEGLWIGEQKLSGAQAVACHLPEPSSLDEAAWLAGWNGKLLKTVKTPSRNTSGMAVGGGYIRMVANAPPQGVFQVDMNSKPEFMIPFYQAFFPIHGARQHSEPHLRVGCI